MPVTPNAFLVADGARHRLTQGDSDVLDRVMSVDLQVALCPNIEIEHRVARDLVEHVIEKRNAGREGRPSAAVDIDRKGDLSLGGLAVGGCGARGHCGELERDSLHEISPRRALAQTRQDIAGSPPASRW